MKQLLFVLLSIPVFASAQIPDLSRIQAPGAPNIIATPATISVTDTTGTPSQPQTINYSFNALTAANGAISMPSWAEGSIDGGFTWHSSFSSLASGAGTLLSRVKSSTAAGTYSNVITFSAIGASSVTPTFNATVVPVPAMSASPLSLTVNGTQGTAGSAVSTTVTYVTTSPTATAPTNTEVSTNGGTSYAASAALAPSPALVWIRTTAAAPVTTISGNLKLTGSGVSEVDVAMSGSVVSASVPDSQFINFDTTETITATHWTNTNRDPSHQNLQYLLSNPSGGFDTLNIVAANWSEYGSCGCSAYPDNGYTSATFAPAQVVKESYFSYNGNGGSNLDPYTSGIYKMWIGGLNPAKTYKFVFSGTLNGSVFNFSANTEYRVQGATLTGPETISCKNNISTVTTTFGTISPDANGRVYIYVNAANLQEMGVITMAQWTQN